MKNLLGIIICIFTSSALANEGVSTKIDPSRLDSVMEWVENSKYTLDTELDNIQRSAIPDQESLASDVIGRILTQSGDKPNEFLMRNVLYRVQVVYNGLKNTPSSPKRNALTRRVLKRGLTWAQELYEPDMNLIRLQREGKLTDALRGAEFTKIGIEWAEYMLSLYYLAPTNTVKFQLMKDAMGLMYNDINNDDAVNRILAPISGAIVNTHNRLQTQNPTNAIAKLRAARELRRFLEQNIEVAKKLLEKYAIPTQTRSRMNGSNLDLTDNAVNNDTTNDYVVTNDSQATSVISCVDTENLSPYRNWLSPGTTVTMLDPTEVVISRVKSVRVIVKHVSHGGYDSIKLSKGCEIWIRVDDIRKLSGRK
jgi:hypothetical protein